METLESLFQRRLDILYRNANYYWERLVGEEEEEVIEEGEELRELGFTSFLYHVTQDEDIFYDAQEDEESLAEYGLSSLADYESKDFNNFYFNNDAKYKEHTDDNSVNIGLDLGQTAQRSEVKNNKPNFIPFIQGPDDKNQLDMSYQREISKMNIEENDEAAKKTTVIINSFEVDEPPTKKKLLAPTLALCIAMLANVYLLVSVFTYSGFMAMHLVPGLTEETSGSYAGLISAAYAIGRALSSFTWGRIADTIGRKPVFYISFTISALFSILFGCSRTLTMAMASRFIMGVGNGLILVSKTTVSEMAKGDQKWEQKSMGLVMGMFGWGFLVAPVISGSLSDPVKQYPNSVLVHYFKPLLSTNPFLLPNIAACVLCVTGALGVFFFVEETLPDERRRSISSVLKEKVMGIRNKICCCFHQTSNSVSNWKKLQSKEELIPLTVSITKKKYGESQKSFETYSMSDSDDSSGKQSEDEVDNDSVAHPSKSITKPLNKENMNPPTKKNAKSISISQLWSNAATRQHLTAFWMLSFGSTLVNEAFPLFAIATQGGLHLAESGVGKILSGSGLMFAICQYAMYTYFVSHYGIYTTQVIGSLMATPVTILMPISLYLNRGQIHVNQLSTSAYIFLSVVIGLNNIGGNIVLCSITIAINRTVPGHHRASMNGLSMLGGSLAKSFGPATAGFLVSFALGSGVFTPTLGAIVLFCCISLYGLCCVYFIVSVLLKYRNASNDIKKT